jgi:prepilin-type N-terminal cleavage/methylation domain-containing protein
MRKKQSGYTLLELLLVIGIMATIAVLSAQSQKLEFEQMGAKAMGMEIYRYNSAVQRYVANMSGIEDPTTITGVKTGTSWLKESGGAPVNFLPESYLTNGKTTHGRLTFTTTLTHDDVNGLMARTVMSPFMIGTQQRGDLSGLAALVASGAYAFKDQAAPPLAEDGTVIYCIDVATMAPDVAAMCQAERNQIVMFAKNLASTDMWLRIDHGNVMQDAFEMRTPDPLDPLSLMPATDVELDQIDSRNNRHIRNVSRIYNLGVTGLNHESENLVIGKRLGEQVFSVATLATNGVIIDSDQEIIGSLRVAGQIDAEGNITSQDGNLYVKDSAGGNNSTNAGNIEADRNITAKQDLIAERNLIAFQDGTINRNLYVQEDAQITNDLVVGGTSSFNSDVLITGNQILNGWSMTEGEIIGLNDIRTQENVYAKKLLDIDGDGSFVVDPSANSKLNQVTLDTITPLDGSNLNISSTSTTNLRGNVNLDNLNVDIDGTYVPLSSMLPKYVHDGTFSVANGGTVPKPNCSSGGIQKVIVVPSSSDMYSWVPAYNDSANDGSTPKGQGAWEAYAQSSGNNWIIRVGSATAGASSGGGGAVVNTYCAY